MDKTRSSVIRFRTDVGFAMTALICTILAANTHKASADIRPELQQEVHGARLVGFDLSTRHHDLQRALTVSPVMQQFAQIIESSRPLDGKSLIVHINTLTAGDADLYRQAFTAMRAKHYAQAGGFMGQIQDKSLIGHILAERYLGAGSTPNYAALAAWLKDYADLPQAARLYAKATAKHPAGSPDLTLATAQKIMRGNLAETGTEPEASISLPETDDSISLDDRRLGTQINVLLRHGKSADAAQLFEQAQTQRKLHPILTVQAPAAIAATAFFNGDTTRIQAMSEQSLKMAPMAAWTAGLHAWRTGSYRVAAKRFGLFAANNDLTPNDRAAGYFWQSRALHKLGFTELAHAALQNAADAPRSFYGMLALAQLGQSPALSWAMPEITTERIQLIAATPGGRRGLALLQIGEAALAVADLQRVKIQGNQPLATALLALAHEANLPALALSLGSTLKTAEGGFFDSALYPLPPWHEEDDKDRALTYAVMRQESGFNPSAISPCGASGLMQLMPRTAKVMAITAPHPQTVDLFNPDLNMLLGTRYIQHLAKQPEIANNLLLVVAAYNGGPGNVARWLKVPAHGEDPLLFIETLPGRETRNYVERVLSSYWVYQARLGQAQDSLHTLSKGQWPQFMPAPMQEAQTTPAPRVALVRIASQ